MGTAISRRTLRHTAASLLACGALVASYFLAPATTDASTTATTFTSFAAPTALGKDGGEPSIGVDWKTGAVMYLAGTYTLRVTGFDPAKRSAHWTDVSAPLTTLDTLDPILYIDTRTNRTFVSQLSAECSVLAYSDDAGAVWTQNPLGCGIANGPDHQTLGGGPLVAPLTGGTPLYRDSLYYCAHTSVIATCSLSLDGGVTFGPAVPLYRPLACTGGTGHIRIAPDGTAYVPHAACGSSQALLVSTDNGVQWVMHKIPGSTTQLEDDPSVAVGSKGTVYFAYQQGSTGNSNSYPYVGVSHDKGATWQHIQNVGAAFGLRNVQFPTIVAGDDARAAFAFLGTKTGGSDQSSTFAGVWHLYVSITTDGGRTWHTVDATPTDPVQRGEICMGGLTGCASHRNLFDFIDITTDRSGRVYVAYADGCIATCVSGKGKSDSSLATIARQSSGADLIAAR